MSLFIAFLAGMLTLLSPCTLPVIPFVFASVRGRKGQLLALLSGMVIMFTSVALLAAVASQWVIRITAAGRWIALLFLTLTALTLLSSRLAQFITRPFVAMGNQLNSASNRNSGLLAALLAGLATGLLWSGTGCHSQSGRRGKKPGIGQPAACRLRQRRGRHAGADLVRRTQPGHAASPRTGLHDASASGSRHADAGLGCADRQRFCEPAAKRASLCAES